MKKHAYLIMAHDKREQLQKLLTLLDDVRNDIYLHVDKHAQGDWTVDSFRLQSSKLYLIERKNVFWADYSQIDVELDLLATATENRRYAYYHLLSGADLPLKSQEEIHNFFNLSGKLFIGIVPQEFYYCIRRVRFYHLFTNTRLYRTCKTLKALDRLLEYAQHILGVSRLRGEKISLYNGWTWFSITDDFARYVLSKRTWIEKHFKYTIASDELVIQTLAFNEPKFRDKLYDVTDLCRGSQRFIDWQRGKPYTWGKSADDFKQLINSPYMFARKFNEQTHSDIVNQIFNYLTKNEQK